MSAPNWANRTLFHHDNLPVLRAMNSESVDLIATDPPFNKGRDFHATPDSLARGASFQDRWSWAKDVHQEWVDQITDDFPRVMNVIKGSRSSYGDDMGAFLCFMAVRLLEMRRVLKSTGSIYLHCDPTASHYLKELMDAVFGKRNFRNEIAWCYRGAGYPRMDFGRRHDLLLRYSKTKTYHFNVDAVREEYAEATKARFSHHIGNKRKTGDYGLQTLNPKGKHPDDWWQIQPIAPSAKERVGYPTQKPLPLYERIIRASSNPGDMVLDPFAGCATTCVAAERQGRQWVGIDIWDKARAVVLERLKTEAGMVSHGSSTDVLTFGDLCYSSSPPARTDHGEMAAPFLLVQQAVRELEGPRMSRAKMYEILLSRQGIKCQGCERKFDDSRYLELDHNAPRKDGGSNDISNRILLCGPCNRAKSHIYTLSGLRRLNKKNRWMAV